MNAQAAMIHLAAHRTGKVTDPPVAKALKAIENDARCREQLAQQTTFDASVCELLTAIAAPLDLRERLQCVPLPAAPKARPRETLTAMLAVALGILVMLGLLIFFQWEAHRNFPGKESLARMASSANGMSGAELEVIANPAGSLGDWFYMRGFDSYQLPPELRAVPAVGSRIFRMDGHMIAQVAIESHQSLVYVFQGDQFGVQLPAGGSWNTFEAEGWAVAARRWENATIMVAFHGTEGEMRTFLASLPQR